MDKKALANKMVDTRKGRSTVWLKNMCPIALHGIASGSTIRVVCDKSGTPLDRQMRRRVNDKDFVVVEKPKSVTPKKEVGGK